MNALEFCYSLQGFAELSLSKTPTVEQWALIKEKLQSVESGDYDGGQGMSPIMFVTWLRGFVEITNPEKLSAQQWTVIREHLGLVFTKVTTETVEDDVFDPSDILDQIKKEVEKKDKPWAPYEPPYEPRPWKKGGPYPWPNVRYCASQANELICASQ